MINFDDCLINCILISNLNRLIDINALKALVEVVDDDADEEEDEEEDDEGFEGDREEGDGQSYVTISDEEEDV